MVESSYDVVVVGAGGDGPVAAWKLALGGTLSEEWPALDVLVIEAGPFHGHENWPDPHEGPGTKPTAERADRLSGALLDRQFTKREFEMTGKTLFGPADHDRGLWFRKFPGDGAILQCAGVGGTTLHYTGNHPRAYPWAIDEQGDWPIDYDDLRPYYREVEAMTDVRPAPVTAKEELFFQGCATAGWDLLEVKNVDRPGYRPQPNAVRQPSTALRYDGSYDGNFRHPADPAADEPVTGDTLAMGFIAGNPHPLGAPFEEKAKRATNVSFVPPALALNDDETAGNVTIRPNAFVTRVHTDRALGTPQATGVTFRDTWSGTTTRVDADVVVLAAGAIETPRLWFNSGLPANEWVGRGLTIHFGDNVMGFWTEDVLEDRLGGAAGGTVDPFVGQNIAARFDYPGLGMLQTTGTGPGVGAILGFGASQSGFSGSAYGGEKVGDYGYTFATGPDEPWDSMGRLAGPDLKRKLARYRRSLAVLVVTDDRPRKENNVSLAGVPDEHGPIPAVNYVPSDGDIERRDELARLAATILRAAGADHVHRSDSPPTALHIHSTMRMGAVVDEACEAYDVDRLFVADHSVLANSLGGPNPTNTGQALASRTAESILDRYF